ncbi:MAG: 3-deoxy-manno-octulosonate cytidylyltransferase [bacterium]|nr:3-deoxy-manno-octulosonate cytidylyltransferase [bacterium]
MKVLGIIPARYGSTRLPGKPLLKIGNKTMIMHVYDQACRAFQNVLIATDDERIMEEANRFNANVVMTSVKHKSGTDRAAEALRIFERNSGKKFDVIINIQGDEPFIKPEQLLSLTDCFSNRNTQIATLIKEINNEEDVFNPDKPKVIINKNNEAVYFSRSPVPYYRNVDKCLWYKHHKYYKHIGIYAYRKDILNEITKLKNSSLEIAESLEQNRWIENAYKIIVKKTNLESLSIDTEGDYDKIKNNIDLLKQN